MKRKILGFIVMLVCIFGIGTASVYAVTGDQIVAKAREQLGKSYSSSDRLGPNSFDCSGLVWYVCNQLGISMSSGNCQSQMSYGTTIDHSALRNSFDCSNLQVGDLIFFDYRDDGVADHVGIYSGNGNMIDALNSNYYGNKVVEHSINVTGNSSVSSTKKFWAYTCGIRRVSSNPTPPSTPTINISAGNNNTPTTISWYSQNATNYYVAIRNSDDTWYTSVMNTTDTSWVHQFAPGTYKVHVEAVNEYGRASYGYISFTVSNLAPATPSISFSIGNENKPTTISWYASGATNYWIAIRYSDNTWYTSAMNTANTSWTHQFAPGTYKVHVEAVNDYGRTSYGYIDFTVPQVGISTSTTAARTNGTIEVQTTISNLSQSAQCVAAVYDGRGKLLGQTANDVNSSTNSVTSYFTNYSNAAYVKVFLWDSLKGMKPLTNGEKVTL